MEKSILLSIRPEWVAKILNGEKTIEIRKKFPKDYVGWVYIYCTKGKEQCLVRNNINGTYHMKFCYWDGLESNLDDRVVARFWCDRIDKLEVEFYKNEPLYSTDSAYQNIKRVCLEQLEDCDYDEDLCDRDTLYTNEIDECEEKDNKFLQQTCLTGKELQKYFSGCDVGYAIHISKLEIFKKLRYLHSFYKPNSSKYKDEYDSKKFRQVFGINRAPQNYCYIEEEE